MKTLSAILGTILIAGVFLFVMYDIAANGGAILMSIFDFILKLIEKLAAWFADIGDKYFGKYNYTPGI